MMIKAKFFDLKTSNFDFIFHKFRLRFGRTNFLHLHLQNNSAVDVEVNPFVPSEFRNKIKLVVNFGDNMLISSLH